jgi:uncharacterized protein (DUF924 family)/2-polyprenyl-3-methyl-5-hydroxy-6-metoxy-1,4-benzoquinol methylase
MRYVSPMGHDPSDVLEFWFGKLDGQGRADMQHAGRWFQVLGTFDDEVRARFADVHRAVAAGECDAWLDSSRGRLAFVVVLDQLSRNLFRGSARMFEFDRRALDVALDGIRGGMDKTLAHDERSFFYMPLMHSEDRAAQDESVARFTALRDEAAPELREQAARTVLFAERHRDVVKRFGRFPHRNAVVGRESTPEEVEFLKQPGSAFMAAAPTAPSAFPNWDALYRTEPVERMPWFFADLDPDVASALASHAIAKGRALDLGTGPGTQAIALAERGFDVTGADISSTAVEHATQRAAKRNARVQFVRDDVLATSLGGPFDLVLDRGCFHVLAPDQRGAYVRAVAGLIRPNGLLFLKTFSDEQPGTQGPHRFAPDQIRAIFEPAFRVESIVRTIYQGTLEPPPRALFCVLIRA